MLCYPFTLVTNFPRNITVCFIKFFFNRVNGTVNKVGFLYLGYSNKNLKREVIFLFVIDLPVMKAIIIFVYHFL